MRNIVRDVFRVRNICRGIIRTASREARRTGSLRGGLSIRYLHLCIAEYCVCLMRRIAVSSPVPSRPSAVAPGGPKGGAVAPLVCGRIRGTRTKDNRRAVSVPRRAAISDRQQEGPSTCPVSHGSDGVGDDDRPFVSPRHVDRAMPGRFHFTRRCVDASTHRVRTTATPADSSPRARPPRSAIPSAQAPAHSGRCRSARWWRASAPARARCRDASRSRHPHSPASPR